MIRFKTFVTEDITKPLGAGKQETEQDKVRQRQKQEKQDMQDQMDDQRDEFRQEVEKARQQDFQNREKGWQNKDLRKKIDRKVHEYVEIGTDETTNKFKKETPGQS